MTDQPAMSIIHNTAENRFEVEAEGHLAVLDYAVRDGVITFTHTGVPSPIEGRGIAGQLVKRGLDYAREENLKVIPACSYVARYLERHPEYQDLTLV